MTDQYQQNSINSNTGSRTFGSSGLLNLDDDLVVIGSGNPTLTLPNARQIPGKEISVKSLTGTGVLNTLLGQTIDGSLSYAFSNPMEGIILLSDGLNWNILGSETSSPIIPSARLYDAVVDINGGADFTSISAAFSSGASSVFVRSGTYVETENINIPSRGCLVGETLGSVIIVLFGGFEVKIDGSSRRTTAGTISINPGSAIVTGAGTSFNSLLSGDFIQIGDAYYQIASITNNTSLSIGSIYRGRPIAGQAMVGQSMFLGVSMMNLFITSGTGLALRVSQAQRCTFEGMSIQANNTAGGTEAILIENCAHLSFNSFGAISNGAQGLHAIGSISLAFLACVFRNNNGAGASFENCRSIVIDASQAIQNANAGFRSLGQTTNLQIDNSVSIQNSGNGIDTSASSRSAVLSDCEIVRNGGFGIDFDGTANIVEGCLIDGNISGGIEAGDNGVIDGCYVTNNTGVGISMQGDQNCAITSCVIDSNTSHGILVGTGSTISVNRIRNNGGDGIRVPSNADDSILTGNRVSGSGGNGVLIQAAGADRTIVTSNNLRGNTGANFVDNGTGTISANNAV